MKKLFLGIIFLGNVFLGAADSQQAFDDVKKMQGAMNKASGIVKTYCLKAIILGLEQGDEQAEDQLFSLLSFEINDGFSFLPESKRESVFDDWSGNEKEFLAFCAFRAGKDAMTYYFLPVGRLMRVLLDTKGEAVYVVYRDYLKNCLESPEKYMRIVNLISSQWSESDIQSFDRKNPLVCSKIAAQCLIEYIDKELAGSKSWYSFWK